MNLTIDQLRGYAIAAGFSGSALDTILAIVPHEGGYRTDAINNTAFPTLPGYHVPGPNAVPEYSVGPLQINALEHYKQSGMTFGEYVNYLLDPAHNFLEGWKLTNGGVKFTDWSSYTQGLVTAPTGAPVTQAVGDLGPIPIPGWLDPTNLPFWNSLSDASKAIFGAIGKPFQLIGDVFAKVVDPHLWWRIGFVLFGVGIAGIGIMILNSNAREAVAGGAVSTVKKVPGAVFSV